MSDKHLTMGLLVFVVLLAAAPLTVLSAGEHDGMSIHHLGLQFVLVNLLSTLRFESDRIFLNLIVAGQGSGPGGQSLHLNDGELVSYLRPSPFSPTWLANVVTLRWRWR